MFKSTEETEARNCVQLLVLLYLNLYILWALASGSLIELMSLSSSTMAPPLKLNWLKVLPV